MPKATEPIDPSIVDKFHNVLMADDARLSFYMKRRGFTKPTVKQFKVGWNQALQRYTLPVFDETGACRNLRMYKFDAEEAKTISYWEGNGETKTTYGENRFFNIAAIKEAEAGDKKIIMCEGEHDCMMLVQHGFCALTRTGGALSWKTDWDFLFKDLNVILMLDCDDAGRTGAGKLAERLMDKTQSLKIVDLGLEDKEDVTDWYMKHGKTADDMKKLIKKTDVYDTHLWTDAVAGVHAENYKKKIKFNAVVVGKETSPFVIPHNVRCRCTEVREMRDHKPCSSCILQEIESIEEGKMPYFGMEKVVVDKNSYLKKTITFDSDMEQIACLVNVNSYSVMSTIKTILHIPSTQLCRRTEVIIDDTQNAESLSIIPEIDWEKDENRYALRTALYMGKDIDANSTFQLRGTMLPDPNTQFAFYLLKDAKPTKDTISRFVLKDEHKEMLKAMQPEGNDEQAVWKKLQIMCRDITANVTHVYGRSNIALATMLVYHSVLHFSFTGRRVRKGWLELAVVGDTETGKTETIRNLVNHIRAGEFISSGENSTIPGILGGLQKTSAGSWFVTWGRVPLNDRGLCVIDEMENLVKQGIVGSMSGVRSEGKAILVKVQTQETTARTRLIWIANPIHGRMSAHDYGVEAIRDLFGAQQDIRRIDLAVGVAKEEISDELINKMHHEKVPHVLTTELLHTSVLRAWNIKSEEVHFEAGVEAYILEKAIELGKTYSAEIPLLQGSGSRIKISRVCVALATMLYSTNTGNDVIVTKAHVDVSIKLLHTLYDGKALGYRSYSDQYRRNNELDRSNLRPVETYFDSTVVIDDVLSQRGIVLNDLEDIFNLPRESAKALLYDLRRSRCLFKHVNYYKKTPAFIDWLRDKRDSLLETKTADPF
jgi:5S rRNA maturation endonuclease (ribonuclease M5)